MFNQSNQNSMISFIVYFIGLLADTLHECVTPRKM